MSEARFFLSRERAIELLGGPSDQVHCFRNAAFGLAGADWHWRKFEELLAKADKVELSGPTATKLGHPLCVWVDGSAYFFGKA